MKKTRVAIVGYGNVGRGVQEAIKQAPDMELSAIFTRRPKKVSNEVNDAPVFYTASSSQLESVTADVAILCGGSARDLPVQGPSFAKHFSTVDSFDTHFNANSNAYDVPEHFAAMQAAAIRNGHVSIISAGWDPGIFSLMRILFDAILPGAHLYTFWGPGVSQGHSSEVRKIRGVKDARQYTIPIDDALEQVRQGKTPDFTARQMHKRIVYVVADKGADKERIKQKIISMPNYFEPYDTEVIFITAGEMKKNHSSYPHGGFVLVSGMTGEGNKVVLEHSCQLVSNPEFTGSILVACARAAHRIYQEGMRGAFTILDAFKYLTPHSGEELRKGFI